MFVMPATWRRCSLSVDGTDVENLESIELLGLV